MEKNCKWHFVNEGGQDKGPNDQGVFEFNRQPYYSIVREAIQNSLDAYDDESIPVKVVFEFFELSRTDFPNFFKIEDNINQCKKYYSDLDHAKILFDKMLDYLNGREENKKKLKLSCMKISDYNTNGMYYEPENTNSPFYAFLRSGGVSAHKQQDSGGSFGFGKAAYFALSPLKTIIVSTRDKNNKVFFEGSTILTTHKDDSGNKLTAFGYYDNNKGNPTNDENNIPKLFTRKEIGTDINVIGLWDEKERKSLMIKSVLNNFWLAIHDNKLIVQIHDITIDKNNLNQIINDYFPNESESGNAKDIEIWNPKPYYKAVKFVNANDQYLIFQRDLEVLGNVRLFIYLEKGLPNRISFFRNPRMVVFKRTNKKINGYAGVFICDSKKGNKILKLMENPAHNEWEKENYPKREGKIDKIARKAENEISDFVNEVLDSLSKINTGNRISFIGLEEYLSIPEDLLNKEEELDLGGGNVSGSIGDKSKDLFDEETGMQTTTNSKPISIKPTVKPKLDIKDDENVEPDEEGEFEITTKQGGGGGGGPEPPPEPGTEGIINKGKLKDEPTESKILKKVKLRVAAEKVLSEIYHNLIINTDEDIKNGELEFLVGGDNDKDDSLEILSTDKGKISSNKLKNVILVKGKNQIKVRFADNLKHVIKIKAYEVQ